MRLPKVFSVLPYLFDAYVTDDIVEVSDGRETMQSDADGRRVHVKVMPTKGFPAAVLPSGAGFENVDSTMNKRPKLNIICFNFNSIKVGKYRLLFMD